MKIEPPERLEGHGVVLRALRADDAPAYVAAFAEDPELGRLIGMERDPDEASVRRRAAGARASAEVGRNVLFAVADPETDAFWGTMLLHSLEWEHRRGEVGFWLVPGVRGRGLGAGSVRLAVSWAFGALDLLRVEMTTTPDNAGVEAVARRLGFTREGVLRRRNIERGERVDIVWFGVLREEWA